MTNKLDKSTKSGNYLLWIALIFTFILMLPFPFLTATKYNQVGFGVPTIRIWNVLIMAHFRAYLICYSTNTQDGIFLKKFALKIER